MVLISLVRPLNTLFKWRSAILVPFCGGDEPLGAGLLGRYRIRQRADAFDLDGDGVAGLEPHRRLAGHADAVRRAGEDDRAGQQRRAAAEKLDQRRHVEDHVVRVPVLHHLAVEQRADRQRVGIRDFVACHQARARAARNVSNVLPRHHWLPPHCRLPVARADVVGAGVAEHVIEGALAGHVLAAPADDHGQFALVIDLVAAADAAATESGRRGSGRAAGGFHEQHGELGNRRVGLGGVLAVVQADAQERDRHDRREQLLHVGAVLGDVMLAEDVAVDLERRAVRLLRGVTDGSLGILVANDFHSAETPGKTDCAASPRRPSSTVRGRDK